MPPSMLLMNLIPHRDRFKPQTYLRELSTADCISDGQFVMSNFDLAVSSF